MDGGADVARPSTAERRRLTQHPPSHDAPGLFTSDVIVSPWLPRTLWTTGPAAAAAATDGDDDDDDDVGDCHYDTTWCYDDIF